ncbi:unnamed protein product [Protopolystoma xenopodis]|uniref:Uncharacterized protein n=1 Tax=Protopolystoma xenopodis TaxID=117903 RepID=A0A3S5BKS5_9PLAT|nr:unnamed protein product [Protopolystoma xenopodis]
MGDTKCSITKCPVESKVSVVLELGDNKNASAKPKSSVPISNSGGSIASSLIERDAAIAASLEAPLRRSSRGKGRAGNNTGAGNGSTGGASTGSDDRIQSCVVGGVEYRAGKHNLLNIK